MLKNLFVRVAQVIIMILKPEESINKNGEPFYNRISWNLNKDGSVRQLWETITNNKDITIVFDGLYKKVE